MVRKGEAKEDNRKTKRIFTVRVHPRSAKRQLIKISETEFKACLNSPPEKGKANEELLELLADYLGVPLLRLRIIRGETSRIKLIELI
jgi:uncharacterized protein (TIGR00251 family)